MEEITDFRVKYCDIIDVVTENPLKFKISPKIWDFGYDDISYEGFFGGCTAGINTFNVFSDGSLTPCAVLLLPILNLNDLLDAPVDEIHRIYTSSAIIKSLFSGKLYGKCGNCTIKRLCRGCRARAFLINNDLLGEDPSCWV